MEAKYRLLEIADCATPALQKQARNTLFERSHQALERSHRLLEPVNSRVKEKLSEPGDGQVRAGPLARFSLLFKKRTITEERCAAGQPGAAGALQAVPPSRALKS